MKGGQRFGDPPTPYTPPELAAGKINLTHLDSRNVKSARGWVPRYNALADTNGQQVLMKFNAGATVCNVAAERRAAPSGA
jgi:hypothetical protein